MLCLNSLCTYVHWLAGWVNWIVNLDVPFGWVNWFYKLVKLIKYKERSLALFQIGKVNQVQIQSHTTSIPTSIPYGRWFI